MLNASLGGRYRVLEIISGISNSPLYWVCQDRIYLNDLKCFFLSFLPLGLTDLYKMYHHLLLLVPLCPFTFQSPYHSQHWIIFLNKMISLWESEKAGGNGENLCFSCSDCDGYCMKERKFTMDRLKWDDLQIHQVLN